MNQILHIRMKNINSHEIIAVHWPTVL